MKDADISSNDESRLTNRRDVLKGLAAGSAAAAGALLPTVTLAASDKKTRWAREVDVIVVGSGAAGSAAAIAAAKAGASVVVLEKMPFHGGTCAKSGGVHWIPNNPYLKSQGIADERIDALRYMVRLAHPTRYNPDDALLGITQPEFDLLATFYDHGSRVLEELMAATGMKVIPWYTCEDKPYPDYYADIPENKVRRGRSLVPDLSGHPEHVIWGRGGGSGAGLIWQLQQGFAKLKIELLLEHRVTNLTRSADGEITGVVVDDGENAPFNMRARKGVVFCSGGFTHNVGMARNYLKGAIWGGCASPSSTGDFVNIAIGAGAALGNMNNAWWGQIPVELALKTPSVPADVWSTPGDSMIQVNRYGRRFGNEKIQYNERTQLHFVWDPVRGEYTNLLSFMIWDARTAKHYAGFDPIPAANSSSAQVIEGATLEALAQNIGKRLAGIAKHTANLKLDKDFVATLRRSIERFNTLAKKGVDEDFHRGESSIETAFQFFNLDKAPNPYPNMMMHPIADKGPYYAVILGAGVLDTKGGAVVNSKGEVLRPDNKPIKGLYAAGNCVAHPAAQAYWGGGGTIGPAMVYGYLAGTAAAGNTVKAG